MPTTETNEILRIEKQQTLIGDATHTGPMILHAGYPQHDRAGTVRRNVSLHELPVIVERCISGADGIAQTDRLLDTEGHARLQNELLHLLSRQPLDHDGWEM